MENESIIIYTDGSSRGNPGPGGYGIVMMFKQKAKELSGGFRLTTNNRMELMAVIVALEQLKTNQYPIVIYSDSQYVVNAIEKGWLRKWIQTGFQGGKKNADLWRRYNHISKPYKIAFKWVKGHAENPWNNRCDALATAAADQKGLPPDSAYESGVEG
jgi:ribonuclease HI